MAPRSPTPRRSLTDRLAALLADHMARTDESAADVARRLGVDTETVRRWIAREGRDPQGADEFAHLDTAAKLGAWLRVRIIDSGRSVREIAEATESVSTSTVYNWLRGEHLPPPPTGEEPDRFDMVLRHPALGLDLRRRVQLDEVRRRLTGASLQITGEPAAVWPARALPAGNRAFTGRGEEHRRLDRLLAHHARGTVVVISALTGMGGAGKTALAVHWARTRQVRATFTDGCLYIDLNGYAESPPLSVDTALRKLLQQLGTDPKELPADTDDLAARYQESLAGRQLLLVLDNAHGEPQVRPLLPADPGCLAVVTSRNRLQGLDVTDGPVTHLRLDVLTPREAASLLRKLLGALATKSTSDEDIDALGRACGYLPLALQIAAANYLARARPENVTIGEYAASLGERPLNTLAVGPTDPDVAVTSVLDTSYRHLSPDARRAYRFLGLHPGPDWTPEATASLIAETPDRATSLVTELVDANLAAEHRPGRYAFHDLVRDHAAHTAGAVDTEEIRREATGRLLDHYLHSAFAADRLLSPTRDGIELTLARAGTLPERPDTHDLAMQWFSAEYQVLLAALERAAEARFDDHVWRLAWILADFQDFRGLWTDMVAVWRKGTEAARRLGDDTALGNALRTLGFAHVQLERLDDARQCLDQALAVFDRLGDHTGRAHTHVALSWVSESEGSNEDMLAHLRHALEHYRIDRHVDGEARALNGLGWGHALHGDLQEALAYCEKALELHRSSGNRAAQAGPLDSLGYVYQRLGRYRESVDHFQQAVAIHRAFENRRPEALVLIHLGEAHHAAGQTESARDAWTRSLTILDELDHPDTERVRTLIAELEPPTD